jgi:hypothetical protein
MRAVRGDEARVKVHSGQLISGENQIGARLVQPGGLSCLTNGLPPTLHGRGSKGEQACQELKPTAGWLSSLEM